MDNRLIAVGMILALLIISFLIEATNRRKLRKKVREGWGRWPYIYNNDTEKSLKKSYEQMSSRINKDSYIDDITWNDLDMFEVFKMINHTYSSVGSEGLYRRLRAFDFSGKDQSRIEGIIDFYNENPDKRENVAYLFARLGLGLAVGSIVFNLLYSQMQKASIGSELASMNYLVRTLSTAKQLSKLDAPLKEEITASLAPLRKSLSFSFAFRIGGSNEGEILFDYLNMMFMLPFISYHFVFNNLKQYEEEALKLWEILGDLEAAGAILNYRQVSDLSCQPIFTDLDDVSGMDVYHPLIEVPVVNPVNWVKDTLVSGSNASGKSTYVKSIAINCILAQTIYTCTASSFSLKRGHILTSMAVEDDVMTGDSYFIAEIKSLKRVLDKVGTEERCYCFVDEILKGTNTIERIAASASIIKWLAEYPSLAFIATHDIELTDMLKSICSNVHFQETVTPENGIEFDYQLRSGPSTTRNALQLLDIMEFPESIVVESKSKATSFDETKAWV